ncbi:MAG: hypothetical protein IKD07_04425, partial [Clostridia bacterium]|nr:hypothetical protein [Clostridia bacterium]
MDTISGIRGHYRKNLIAVYAVLQYILVITAHGIRPVSNPYDTVKNKCPVISSVQNDVAIFDAISTVKPHAAYPMAKKRLHTRSLYGNFRTVAASDHFFDKRRKRGHADLHILSLVHGQVLLSVETRIATADRNTALVCDMLFSGGVEPCLERGIGSERCSECLLFRAAHCLVVSIG